MRLSKSMTGKEPDEFDCFEDFNPPIDKLTQEVNTWTRVIK